MSVDEQCYFNDLKTLPKSFLFESSSICMVIRNIFERNRENVPFHLLGALYSAPSYYDVCCSQT